MVSSQVPEDTEQSSTHQTSSPPPTTTHTSPPPPTQTPPVLGAASNTPSSSNPIINLLQAHHVISTKLTPTNYILWKNQLVPFLKGLGLLGYVTGAVPPPPSPSLEFDHWDQQDASILSCLISSLSEEVAPDSVEKPTSKALWDALRATYQTDSTIRGMNLKDDLCHTEQQNLSISAYFNRCQRIRDELFAINKAPSHEDYLCQVLSNLRDDFSEMRTTILPRVNETSVADAKSLLMAHSICLISPSLPLPQIHLLLFQNLNPLLQPLRSSLCNDSNNQFNAISSSNHETPINHGAASNNAPTSSALLAVIDRIFKQIMVDSSSPIIGNSG